MDYPFARFDRKHDGFFLFLEVDIPIKLVSNIEKAFKNDLVLTDMF